MFRFDSKIYERDIYEDTVYSAWLKNSNERDVLEEVFRERLNWWSKDNMSILDIGCGTGSAAQRLFKILNEQGFSFTYTGVDPYVDQLIRFRDAFQDQPNIQLIQSKVEDFEADNRFDLTLLIHSLYYANDLIEVIRKVLIAGDKMIIVHHGKFGINEVHQQFRNYVRQGSNIISTWEDVKKALDFVNIQYDLQIRNTETNVASCKDSRNNEGRRLIKFFLEHSELPEKTVEEVSDWFKLRPDILKQDVGYFFVG